MLKISEKRSEIFLIQVVSVEIRSGRIFRESPLAENGNDLTNFPMITEQYKFIKQSIFFFIIVKTILSIFLFCCSLLRNYKIINSFKIPQHETIESEYFELYIKKCNSGIYSNTS